MRPHRFAVSIASVFLLLGSAALQLPAQAAPIQFKHFPHGRFIPGGFEFTIALDADRNGIMDLSQAYPATPCNCPLCGPTIFRNRGNGTFDTRCASNIGWPGNSAAWDYHDSGDIDGDGDLDIVAPRFVDEPQTRSAAFLYRNDGMGNFAVDPKTMFPRPAGFQVGRGVVLFDMDRDRDLDVYVMQESGDDRLYRNDGASGFVDVTATHLPSMPEQTRRVAHGDLDGDGYEDLVWTGISPSTYVVPRRILLNDKTGRFRIATLLPQAAGEWVELGDVDGDRDLDLMTAQLGVPPWELWLNDGKASFTPAHDRLPQFSPPHGGNQFKLIDLDGDGDLDAYGVWTPDKTVTWGIGIWLNDGTGWFTDVMKQAMVPPAVPTGRGEIAADLDGDGDVDLAACGNPYADRSGYVLFNLHRQLDVPAQAKLGMPFPIDAWADPNHLVFPHAGANRVDWNIPGIGRWVIDPATWIPLGAMLMPASRTARLTLTVPNDPRLIGTRFTVQAIDAWGSTNGTQLRAMNWLEARIVP